MGVGTDVNPGCVCTLGTQQVFTSVWYIEGTSGGYLEAISTTTGVVLCLYGIILKSIIMIIMLNFKFDKPRRDIFEIILLFNIFTKLLS